MRQEQRKIQIILDELKTLKKEVVERKLTKEQKTDKLASLKSQVDLFQIFHDNDVADLRNLIKEIQKLMEVK